MCPSVDELLEGPDKLPEPEVGFRLKSDGAEYVNANFMAEVKEDMVLYAPREGTHAFIQNVTDNRKELREGLKDDRKIWLARIDRGIFMPIPRNQDFFSEITPPWRRNPISGKERG